MTMRVRAQDTASDMTFGRGAANYLVDSPDAVAQVVLTRLRFNLGEWFLDSTEGTAWATLVLGAHTGATYDGEIRGRILGTQGVKNILSYSSTKTGRSLSVAATLDTIFGAIPFTAVL